MFLLNVTCSCCTVYFCYGCCWAERIEEEERDGVVAADATVPVALQYLRVLFTDWIVAVARAAGALETPAVGLRPRPAREKGFPSNILLD
jgi:hypothetical protein